MDFRSQDKLPCDEKGYHKISITVIPNFELTKAILLYGDKIEVQEPESLRNKIKHHIAKITAKYILRIDRANIRL